MACHAIVECSADPRDPAMNGGSRADDREHDSVVHRRLNLVVTTEFAVVCACPAGGGYSSVSM